MTLIVLSEGSTVGAGDKVPGEAAVKTDDVGCRVVVVVANPREAEVKGEASDKRG